MNFIQKPLPFNPIDIHPFMSDEQIKLHYHMHHKSYVTKTNEMLAVFFEKNKTNVHIYQNLWNIIYLIDSAHRNTDVDFYMTNVFMNLNDGGDYYAQLVDWFKQQPQEFLQMLYNQTAQIINHDFFWMSLVAPMDHEMKDVFHQTYTSVEDFRQKFINLSMNHFGSGWIWMFFNKKINQICLVKTSNADIPFLEDPKNMVPIAVCDLWEHAFYVDYPAKKKAYVEAFIDRYTKKSL